MRTLFASKIFRRSPPLFLFRFSDSIFPSSDSIYRHHHLQKPQLPSILNSLSPYKCQQFSSLPDFESILPVRALISLLDGYHDYTGLRWWIIISSSTLAMRLLLVPLVVIQLQKLKTIADILPKLPPPFPPPLSGTSFRDQITLFRKEKQTAGCPSFFWFIASFSVQAPCFFLWVVSIRRMSLDHHPDFDLGGILWFQNLTEYPHGDLGPVFPLLIAGLHFTNIQVLLQKSSLQMPGTLGLLAKAYKIYLELLTLPILFITFNVPQGSLIYWLTNSSLSLMQQLCLKNPIVLKYFGLPLKTASLAAPINGQSGKTGVGKMLISTKQGQISAESLSPKELVGFSVKVLTDGHKDAAIKLLRLALEKDPGYVRALIILGQTLLQKQQLIEASECFESAVSKLLVAGHPTGVEELDLLILSSQWAGSAYVRQGKMEEGLVHLERLGRLKEPEDSKARLHYYDGLIFLASALLNVGRKVEALNYLRKAVAYNPTYQVYLQQCEEEDDFARDLASAARRDF